MAIVHIGKLALQVPESGTAGFVFELVEQMRSMILHLVSRCLEESLETEVDRTRPPAGSARRRRVKRKETGVYCSRCRSHQRQDFRRNGHYLRQLALQWGRETCRCPKPNVDVEAMFT